MGKIEEDLLKHLETQKAEEDINEAKKKAMFDKDGTVRILGILGILALLAWKFKFIFIFIIAKLKYLLLGAKFLGIGKFLLSGGTMLLNIFVYAKYWGLPYALGFVLLIFFHEAGHVMALYRYGIKASLPLFIPFVGAFVALKEMPKNVSIEANAAIAGPILGSIAAFACYGIYYYTKIPLFLSLAYVGFMINLFNLMPILPLDGGRIVGAISPGLWILGLVICGIFTVIHPNILLIVLVLMSIPRFISTFRLSPQEADYFKIPSGERTALTLAYFGLAAILGLCSIQSHTILQGIIA